MEVIEDASLAVAHPGPVPVLALLAAAPQPGDRIHAAGFRPGQRRGRITGQHADTEPAIPGQDGRPRLATILAPGDDQHPHRGPVRGLVGNLPRIDVGNVDGARRPLPQPDPAGAGVVAVDGHRRGVVGVGEPRLVPALGPLAQPADGAEAGQRDAAQPLAGGQVVHADLANGVPGPGRQQHGPAKLVAVQDRVAGQDSLRILRDLLAPAAESRLGRVGGQQPAARRVPVGEDVQHAVPAGPGRGLRIDVLLQHAQVGRGFPGGRQVGEPEVVARRGAGRRADDQPAAVQAHRGHVVVRLLPALAEDHRVVIGGPAGDTDLRRPARCRGRACGCSRTPCRPAARPRRCTGSGRSGRLRPGRSRHP